MALNPQAPCADSRLDEKQQQSEDDVSMFPFFVSEVVFVEVMCLYVYESLI